MIVIRFCLKFCSKAWTAVVKAVYHIIVSKSVILREETCNTECNVFSWSPNDPKPIMKK